MSGSASLSIRRGSGVRQHPSIGETGVMKFGVLRCRQNKGPIRGHILSFAGASGRNKLRGLAESSANETGSIIDSQ